MLSICAFLPGTGTPVKNALGLCIAFFFVFTGFNCSVNLLSTLAIKDGLGMASQSVLYCVFIFGSITMPPLFMKAIGLKSTVALSALLYTPYIAANFKPDWYTFIPSAVLVGLAAGPLWSAGLSYLTAMAKRHSVANGKTNADDTTFLFIGILFMFLGFGGVFGNIISFFVLMPKDGYATKNLTEKELEICGINFCDSEAENDGAIQQPSMEKVHLLTGLYVACALAGVLTAILILEGIEITEVGLEKASFKELLTAPVKRFRLLQHWLILPVTVFAGIEESFLYGDFTKAYVACSWGIYHIGLCMMSTAVVTCLASPFLGWVVKYIDRAYIFALAGILQAGILVILWVWTPQFPTYVLYIIPGVWGFVTTVWQCQVRAMYAVLFPEDKSVAFSVMAALESMGYMIGYAMSSKVCTAPKLWIMAIWLVISLVGYGVADFTHRRATALGSSIKCKDKSYNTKL